MTAFVALEVFRVVHSESIASLPLRCGQIRVVVLRVDCANGGSHFTR